MTLAEDLLRGQTRAAIGPHRPMDAQHAQLEEAPPRLGARLVLNAPSVPPRADLSESVSYQISAVSYSAPASRA